MAPKYILGVALLLLAGAGESHAQTPPDRWTCVQQRLDQLGYQTVHASRASGTIRAARRIGGPAAAIREASRFATGVATLGFVQPMVERRFDELTIKLLPASAERAMDVDASLVVVSGAARKPAEPRARSVIEAYQLTSACKRPR